MNFIKLKIKIGLCITANVIVLNLFSCRSLEVQPPNVILIITDDQGYGDLSCHGNPVIKTPHIDALYSQSIRFTNFHVDPTCAPTRAALMTGRYSHHTGVWHTVLGGNHLRASETTIAEIFKENGYRTGLFGKWHLGANYPYRPMDRGYDEWLGQGDGGTGTTDDWFDNDRVNDYYWHNGKHAYREGFAPDVFFNATIDFIQKDDQPFFAYLATYLPHNPHTIPDTTLIERYKTDISDNVAYFFAGIDRIDQNIGKLRKALEVSGKAQNTILIFMTDNGGTAGVSLFNAGMRGRKGHVYEGGHRVPFFIHWPARELKQGRDVSALTAHIDILPTLIDLCGLNQEKEIDFDGRSFMPQLFNPDLVLPERTIFVEAQRTLMAQPWHQTAGMTDRWRLIDNKELYDIKRDPGQTTNVIQKHPEIVNKIREKHKEYWERVTPGDRDKPCPIVGHPNDPEVFLASSEWLLTKGLWNHAQVAEGYSLIGSWNITIAKEGVYSFEISRWPREANTPIQEIPFFKKKIDSWGVNGSIDKLIYGNKMESLPVHRVKLEVGDYSETKMVSANDTKLTFDIELKEGDTCVKGTMLDRNGNIIAGTYYIYITQSDP